MCIRLMVRASREAYTWDVDDWTALVALAVLSAEPETIDDFFTAVRRYQPDHQWQQTGQTDLGLDDLESPSGEWCLIDLPSRSVVAGPEFELPTQRGAHQVNKDEQQPGFHITWFDLPSDWFYEQVQEGWQSVLDDRTEKQQRQPKVEVRTVLFGDPMLAFIAKRVLIEAPTVVDEPMRYQRIRAIHAEWLMTAREDLLGKTPREVLLARQPRVDRDIQRRSEQWTMQGFAPEPLSTASTAFREGGFGTTEIVLYFDLMRSLFADAWTTVTNGESDLQTLLERLVRHRDQWLKQPPEDGMSELSTGDLILAERQRLPITEDAGHLDCECPICQAMADGLYGDAPMFMVFDAHHLEMEDNFAFSLTESFDEWKMEQAAFNYWGEDEADEHQAERAWPVTATDSIWQSSSVNWDDVLASNNSPVSAKLMVGFPLAELIAELQQRDAPPSAIATLNDAFATFRRADNRLAEQTAAISLFDCLEKIAAKHPDLVARSADLQSRLDEVLRL